MNSSLEKRNFFRYLVSELMHIKHLFSKDIDFVTCQVPKLSWNRASERVAIQTQVLEVRKPSILHRNAAIKVVSSKADMLKGRDSPQVSRQWP
jgi:hypothetical protein